MAESGAVRMRRSRAHARGDHQFCRDGCQGPPADAVLVLEAVRAELADAGREDSYLGRAALSLAARIDGAKGVQGVAPMVKELRETMTAALAGSQKVGKLLEMRGARGRSARKGNAKAVDPAAS